MVRALHDPPPDDLALASVTGVSGRPWQLRRVPERIVLACAQRHRLPEPVARVICTRGIDLETVPGWLAPKIRDQMPDPSTLVDLDVAVERIAAAVRGGETIGIIGDYDVDGLTSTALVAGYLEAVGAPVAIHIPDRLGEGYGPSVAGVDHLKAQGATLLLTLDCGTTAHEPLAHAAAVGLETVIIDHHTAEPRVPVALAMVNPNRLDETGHLKQLAAVGVSFMVLAGLTRRLRALGWFGNDRLEPDLRAGLDLVALGTVCDIVPLTGLNRAFVSAGLQVLAKRRRPGLRSLARVAGLKEKPSAGSLGFTLGPRINAGGRLGRVAEALSLLRTDSFDEAETLAQTLHGLNRDRQETEQVILDAALGSLAGLPEDQVPPLVMADGEDWHVGVIGIVAARLKERFQRPAAVIAWDGDVGTASARSVPGIHLGSAVIAARQAGLLLAGGGHAMAAGFKVARDNLEPLRRFLAEHVARQADGRALAPVLDLDSLIPAAAATIPLVRMLEQCQPFGAGNPAPRFALLDHQVQGATVLKEAHVKARLVAPEGGKSLEMIAFRTVGTAVGDALLTCQRLHVAGQLSLDEWGNSPRVQLKVEDVARV